MTNAQLKKIRNILGKIPRTVILTHFNPDGDAIGSALAVFHYLSAMGCRCSVAVPDAYPDYLAWMPSVEKIIVARDHPGKAADAIMNAGLIMCVDFNQLKRLMGMEDYVRKSEAPKILVDHHESPEDFHDFLLSEPSACSSAELVYKFFVALYGKKYFNKKIVDCLYTGILTDSMGFRIGNANAQTHRIVSELIELGTQYHRIHNLVYDTNTLDRLRLIGYCLSEKLQVFPEISTALITLSQDELRRFNHRVGDTEGVVNYALSIKGIHLAVFIVERKTHVKLSFRSKNNFPVHTFAKEHFHGGGHFHAAGGETKRSIDETVTKLKNLLPQYEEMLNGK
ncbi:MAG: DHH family phosphoesterase [Bacteroidetes bacterium]|nr:DHH family phosphoesterase [Bacteroidota bacterium]